MLPRQSGRIIVISSLDGKVGGAGRAIYSACKHGVNGLVKAVAKEVGTSGVTVNAICPGAVLTDQGYAIAASLQDVVGYDNLEELIAAIMKESAIQRPLEPAPGFHVGHPRPGRLGYGRHDPADGAALRSERTEHDLGLRRNGHRVRLILADDGGDPNQALALARRMVEEQGVVAFFAEFAPTSIQAVLPYLEQRQIPVIGGCNCFQGTAESPVSFQVGTGSKIGLGWAHLLPLKAYAPDVEKASLQYCREAPTCKTMAEDIKKLAPRVGVEIVHEAQTTLTQPDYTAEVISARNAGAEVLILATENFSAVRTIRSAHRQNYRPLVAIQWAGHDERFPREGGEDVEGALVAGTMPSWESPKMAEYRDAMARFAPGALEASIGQHVYMAGRLLEVIAKSFPDKPASADFLRGLYSLRGETLGGVIPPLTYREGQGHDESNQLHLRLPDRERSLFSVRW